MAEPTVFAFVSPTTGRVSFLGPDGHLITNFHPDDLRRVALLCNELAVDHELAKRRKTVAPKP